MRIFYSIAIIIGILISLVSSVVIYQIYKFNETRIIFLDIGQGDSILITEGDYQVLIDGGADSKLLQEKLGKFMPFWDRTIDVIIATHLDNDHISGLVDVLENYKVHKFWYSNTIKDTDTAIALKKNVEKFNIESYEPVYGDKILFPSKSSFKIIYPIIRDINFKDLKDTNEASITGVFQVANEKFFLGGDLPFSLEEKLDVGKDITVLKAGHHGSKTSTSQIFLDKIKPRDAIISAGKYNRYGHPHKEVINRLVNGGVRIFKTFESGDIIYSCKEKCEISFD